MKMKRKQLLLAPALVAAALALGGCAVHGRVVIPLGPPVIVAHGHAHSAACGHFRHRGRWYYSEGHRHGPSCGHHLRGGVWILVR